MEPPPLRAGLLRRLLPAPRLAGAGPGRGLDRRREKADNTRVLSFLELERLWSRESVGLRERCLWRLLYETAGRADEVLSLNVEDVDVANKRAVVISKGGDRELLHFQTGSARLLRG